MKIIQVIPKAKNKVSLKSLLKKTERGLRDKGTTLIRYSEGKFVHAKYSGWINWEEAKGGLIVAEVQTRQEEGEWQLLQSFVGYLDRHLGDHIESISIIYR
jgi:hypothetical protein